MKALSLFVLASFLTIAINAQQSGKPISKPDPNKKIEVVEASCGQCNFKLAGKGCNLAVRMNGKAHFVDGTAIDEHGDAHSKDGFCEVVRKAEVQGTLVNDRFQVTYFKLLPVEPKKD